MATMAGAQGMHVWMILCAHAIQCLRLTWGRNTYKSNDINIISYHKNKSKDMSPAVAARAPQLADLGMKDGDSSEHLSSSSGEPHLAWQHQQEAKFDNSSGDSQWEEGPDGSRSSTCRGSGGGIGAMNPSQIRVEQRMRTQAPTVLPNAPGIPELGICLFFFLINAGIILRTNVLFLLFEFFQCSFLNFSSVLSILLILLHRNQTNT